MYNQSMLSYPRLRHLILIINYIPITELFNPIPLHSIYYNMILSTDLNSSRLVVASNQPPGSYLNMPSQAGLVLRDGDHFNLSSPPLCPRSH